MIKFIGIVVFVLICFARLIVSSNCPTLGRLYSHSLHINWKENVGYHSLVEVVEVREGSYRRKYLVDDYFDGFTGLIKIFGRLNVSDHQISYHPLKNEGFIVKDGECLSTDLSVSNQMDMIKQWTDFDYYSTVNVTGQLGPNGLLTYILRHIDSLQYVEDGPDYIIDGHHWFTCLSPDGPYVYVHLDSFGSQLPKMLVEFPHLNSSYLTLNWIKLSPFIDNYGSTGTYPFGHGCQRGLQSGKGRPRLGQSPFFILKMESVSFYSGHSVPRITSFNIFKSNGLFSYDIGQQDGSYIRIIRDPNLSKDYTIDLSSGACSSINIMDNQEGCPKWPRNLTYDLISIVLDNDNNDDLSYLGQTVSESRLFDIYEKTVNLFFPWQKSSVIVTYFYLTNSSVNHNQLSRITIKPREDLGKLSKTDSVSTINKKLVNGSSTVTMAKESIYNNDNLQVQQCPSFSKIEIRIVDYMEDEYLYDPLRFDLRSCITSEPNQSTWFQIVFSIVPQFLLSMVNRQSLLETELRRSLDFIPFIRIPEIKVAHYGPSIYITVRLLDSLSLNNNEQIWFNKKLKDSDITILRDDDKNCAQLCFDSSNCSAYSYCSDGRCSLLTRKFLSFNASKSPDQISMESPNCIVGLNQISQTSAGYWTSSTSLLHRIKSMITSRQLIFSRLNLVADDMLIVSGSDELGSYGDLYEFDDSPTSNLNEYRIILSNHDLIKGEEKLTGLSYIDCLYHCQNDDNCLTVSYCNNNNEDNINSECVISSLSAYQVSSNSSNRYIEYNGKCNIMSRSFIHLFNLIPGRSWVTFAQRHLVNISLENCAKTCLDGQSIVCKAFDFCTNSMQTFCYMHKFPIADDSIGFNSGTTSQAQSKLSCNHYSRKMSKDYKQFIGMKFNRNNDNAILTIIDDRSLENCASACNTDEKGCRSFEYCQFNNAIDTESIQISSCRLSTYQVIGNKSRLQPTKDFCSVYGTTKEARKTVIKVDLNVPLTYINGFLCCLFGSFLGSIMASYFLKEVKLTDKRNQELPLTRLN